MEPIEERVNKGLPDLAVLKDNTGLCLWVGVRWQGRYHGVVGPFVLPDGEGLAYQYLDFCEGVVRYVRGDAYKRIFDCLYARGGEA